VAVREIAHPSSPYSSGYVPPVRAHTLSNQRLRPPSAPVAWLPSELLFSVELAGWGGGDARSSVEAEPISALWLLGNET